MSKDKEKMTGETSQAGYLQNGSLLQPICNKTRNFERQIRCAINTIYGLVGWLGGGGIYNY